MEHKIEHPLYQVCLQRQAHRQKAIAVLLDPDKCTTEQRVPYSAIKAAQPDFIFVGGSGINHSIDEFVNQLKQHTSVPVILFPGDCAQFTPRADGLLLLSLVSGRNPDLLIGQHIKAAHSIAQSDVEVISTGYILIQGGKQSSVEKVSHTQPLSEDDTNTITATALAAQLLGMKAIYLEAGSGALHAVSAHTIQAVRNAIHLPLMVGGGICSTEQIDCALNAGADIIVIGNHFEAHPEDIPTFTQHVHQWAPPHITHDDRVHP